VGRWALVRVFALLLIVGIGVSAQTLTAEADEGPLPAYDISWPQCPDNIPQGYFEFAVIGLNNGRPFTSNPCFMTQYKWAQQAEANPAVYINLDFPRQGRIEAANGPFGECGEFEQWCRGYNWGYQLAQDSVRQAEAHGIRPSRYWFDVEMDNYWTNWKPFNAQVVYGALDYFLENHVPIGIYGTNYQWGLITGGIHAPVRLPLWVAGATSREMAGDRCSQEKYTFAGGETWMVQYLHNGYDGNVLCPLARERQAASLINPRGRTAANQPSDPDGGSGVSESFRLSGPNPVEAALPLPIELRTLQEWRDIFQR
jgi:hypothetical protein